jgi:hypothetical protein
MKTLTQSSHICLSLMFFLTISLSLNAQAFKSYSGVVVDSKSNDALHLAALNIEDSNISTVTNINGEFTIKVPINDIYEFLNISYLGYETKQIELKLLNEKENTLKLNSSTLELATIEVNRPKNAKDLVLKTLSLKGSNYLNGDAVMTGFYRETIKKRNRNASLSEAVLKIKKEPYSSNKQDQISIVKARKNVDYTRLDTLAFKLQGGPFSALHTDVIKYPEFIFSYDNINQYNFSFTKSTEVNGKLVYVVNFKQNETVVEPLYYGQLFIDAATNALTRATYKLNLENEDEASALFVRKKPSEATVIPTEANYLVNYGSKDGKWYYAYSNIFLEFKVKWKNDWFSKRYSLQSEMAITNWELNSTYKIANRERLRSNAILEEKASGFSDPDFWGAYNIIEPEKSIESAIKKISKQLNKA